MKSKATSKIDYEQCVSYYRASQRLAGATAIERYLAANPRTAERAARDAERERTLTRFYDPVLDEPIPPRLLYDRGPSPAAWLTGAAGLITVISLSVMGGWWLRGPEPTPSSPASPSATFGQQVARLADQQPTTAAAANTEPRASHPDLSGAGYRFSGQHVVATDGQPLTAYNYRDTNGQHVTIYARPHPGADTATPGIITAAGVSLARWQSQDHDYALTGDLPRTELDRLAGMASTPSRGTTSGNTGTQSTPAVDTSEQQQTPANEGRSVQRTSAQQQPASGL